MRGAPENLTPGQQVDGWRVLARLGGGAYGVVYRVEKEGQHFALKLARHRDASTEGDDTDGRAQRELSCLLALRHPHIVRVVSHGRWPHPRDGYFYLVMEEVDGFTLGEWSEAVHPTFHEVVVLAAKVAAAGAYMHALGIYHRDLKPSNILVRKRDGEPVLVDYGAASFPVSEQLTDKRLPPGTPRYTSPEAARFDAENRHNPAARYPFKETDEVYAFGVTLYDVLTDPQLASRPRHLPVSSLVIPPRSAQVVNRRVPIALSQLVDRLLDRAPEHRPPTMEAVRRAMAEFIPLQSEEWLAPAHPPSAQVVRAAPAAAPNEAAAAPPPVAPSTSRHMAWRSMAALGGLVSVAAIIVFGTWSASGPAAPATAPLLPQHATSVQPGAQDAEPFGSAAMLPPMPARAASVATAPLEPAPLLTPAPQKGTPMNPPLKNPAADVCTEKRPPSKDTAAFRAWCRCVGIVGSMVAVQAGCASPQVRPGPGQFCPEDAKEAMRVLGLDERNISVRLDKNQQPTDPHAWVLHPEGPVTGVVLSRTIPGMPYGTLLHGHLFFFPDPWVRGGTATHVRYTRAELPNGKTYPICFEYPSIPRAKAEDLAPLATLPAEESATPVWGAWTWGSSATSVGAGTTRTWK
jgi:eukaryotic-like serine/threonine-protein kinase